MRVPLPARVLVLAALPICLGFLATTPEWASAQSRAVRIPAVNEPWVGQPIQRVSARTDAPLKLTAAEPMRLEEPRLERLPGIERLPEPVGEVATPRRLVAGPASAAELEPSAELEAAADPEPHPDVERAPHDTSEFEPAITLAPAQPAGNSNEHTSDELASDTAAPTSATDRWAMARRQNKIAEPLSGEFDFEQPMEALPTKAAGDWKLQPMNSEAITLPQAVEARAQELLLSATMLADRGAIYAANREFLRVMRMITQSLDSQLGRQYHTRALAAGLRALEEAEDFSLAHGNRVEDDVHLARYVSGHRTPVLKDADLDQMTPLRAIQRYYEFARRQLTIAAGNTRLGSHALYALGRAEMFLGKEKPVAAPGAPKSIAFFHAALSADPKNVRAGNELAVMLARRGRLHDAAHLLQQGVQVSPLPTTVNNLARVFEQLGDPRSTMMRRQARQLAAGSSAAARPAGAPRVTWVDPASFAAMNHTTSENLVESRTPTVGQATWTAPSRPYQHATEMIRTALKDPATTLPMPEVRNAEPLENEAPRRGPWW